MSLRWIVSDHTSGNSRARAKVVEIATRHRWGALGIVLVLVVALIKIWFWMEMQSVLREVKRVDLLRVSRPPG